MKVLTTPDGNTVVVEANGQQYPVNAIDPSALGAGNVFVWRPGGVAGANVYTTWGAAVAAMALVQGPKILEVDTSLGGASVPAGTYVLDDVTLVGKPSLFSTLSFESGVRLNVGGSLTIDGALQVAGALSSPVLDVNGGLLLLTLLNSSGISVTGTAGFVEVRNGGVFQVLLENNATLDSGSVRLTGVGLSAFFVARLSSTISANVVLGAGTLASFTQDSTSRISDPQVTAIVLDSDATHTLFVPQAAAYWLNVPANVQAAINQLQGTGALVGVIQQSTGQVIPPGIDTTVTFNLPVIQQPTGWTTTPNVLTVPATGVYLLIFAAGFTGTALPGTANRIQVSINVGSVLRSATTSVIDQQSFSVCEVATIAALTAGQQVSASILWGAGVTGVALDTTPSRRPLLQAHLIR